jgi:hypothetical protein
VQVLDDLSWPSSSAPSDDFSPAPIDVALAVANMTFMEATMKTTKRDLARLVHVAKRVMPPGTPQRELERLAKRVAASLAERRAARAAR